MIRFVFFLVALSLTVACSGCERKAATSTPSSGPPVAVPSLTAAALLKEYKTNELAADAKYKNKTIELSGKVGPIQSNALGEKYLAVLSDDEDDLVGIPCFFTDQMKAEATKLEQGKPITVRGVCKGRMAGTLLRLHDCTFMKP